jgi:hypothetical protein
MPIPPNAYVDRKWRFAITVPRGWKIVDPQKITFKGSVSTDWNLVATLVSDAGSSAPTVTVNARQRGWANATPDSRGIAEVERWIHAAYGSQASLQLETKLRVVSTLDAFYTWILATLPNGRRMTMDMYVVPVVNETYAITATLDGGDKHPQTAEAALAVAQGFYVFKGWE